MGCKLDEDEEALCVVRDFSGTSQEIKVTLSVPAKMTIRGFIREVSRKFNFDPTSIQLVSPSKNFILYPDDDDFMIDKVSFISGTRNLFVVEGLNNCPPKLASKEDDLEIGASASPDEAVTEGPQPELPPGLNISNFYPICSSWKSSPYITPESSNRILGFRGLVNQAMTCYLNSLLQALYMTPEFRNAIYNWKFDRSTCADEAKSIPFQLQKLFLNLQMSTQSSVHTTELTRSFGWDSSEAWQQHDIQELCRVMFDALEQEFKGTDQADLINRLYCGKMIDYVKCLDCGTEKTREDTFSDIPLPIRPHGSVVAYSSVEEALRGFVQPETLDGNNQYFCEKCNRKCDAHKGLKFSKFPYLLTLHLMRFDFDYNSMHRIKLNDRVSFPEILNLNSIISSSSWTTLDKEEGSEGYPEEMTGTSSKCDDSSTTDSGSAIDDESCGIASSNDLNVEYDQDVDEGIDLSTQENEKTRKAKMEKGPYIYELFAVMVHAGSATGGHYYVLIKDLHSGEWYSFNDQTVNRVTPEDITRVYGGGPSRSYYTSSYGSNNNAYMLMYRQIDKEKNTLPMTEQEFPDHIKELLENLEDRSDLDLRIRDKEKETFKIKVFVKHPVLNHNIDVKIECLYNTSLPEVTQLAYNKLQLEGVVPLNQCRLVIYNSISGTIEGSLENCMSDSIGNILSSYNVKKGEMWLDIRPAEKEFVTYKPSSVMIPVYNINLETEVVQNQTTICISMLSLVGELKLQLYEHFGIHPVYDLHLFKVTGDGIFKFVDNENYSLREAGLYPNAKLFVCFVENISRTQCRLTIRRIVDKFENTIHLRVFLPSKTEISEFKQNLSLASYIYDFMRTEDNVSNSKSEAESNNNAQNNVTNSNNGESGNNGLLLPLLLSTPPLNANDPEISEVHSQLSNSGLMSATHHSDQSTSEDSSLTDSDRTIIGDPHQDDCPMPSNESSPNGSQCCSSPSDNLFCKEDELNIVNDITETEDKKNYFKIVGIFESDPTRVMKVEVDRRISPDVFKKALEPHVGISTAHFRLYDDIQALHESCMLGSFEITSLVNVKPEDPLHVKLGRSDKLRGTIFLLDLCSTTQENDELFTWTMDRQSTVGETKKKILQEYNEVKRSAIPFNRCRLRKKYSKTPGQIFPESKTWKDLNLCNNFEIYLQLLRGAEQMKTSDDEYCLTLCRVQPLDKTPVFEEIVVPRTNMLDLLTRISEKTGIPEKDLIIGKDPRDNFKFGECDNIDWTSMLISDSWPSFINEDGYVLYYRDTRDPIHSTVIVHERNNTRNDRKLKSTKMRMEAALTNKVTFMSSPKKEKSLRITVDKPCM